MIAQAKRKEGHWPGNEGGGNKGHLGDFIRTLHADAVSVRECGAEDGGERAENQQAGYLRLHATHTVHTVHT